MQYDGHIACEIKKNTTVHVIEQGNFHTHSCLIEYNKFEPQTIDKLTSIVNQHFHTN